MSPMSSLKFERCFLICKFLRLKLLGNSCSNSYTKFVILDVKFHFTFGEFGLQ